MKQLNYVRMPIKAPECDILCAYRPCYHPGEAEKELENRKRDLEKVDDVEDDG